MSTSSSTDTLTAAFADFCAVILGLAGVAGIIALSSILNGFALSIVWGWFVVPLFHLPVLSIPAAIGLTLTIRFITHTDTSHLKKADDYNGLKHLGASLLWPFVVLGVGAVVHLFV